MELNEFKAQLRQLKLSVLTIADVDNLIKKVVPPKGICHDFATIATKYNKI